MTTIIQKLGNEHDLLISKFIWDTLKVSDNEKVEIVFDNNELRIRKPESVKHKSIEERLESYFKKDIEDILIQSDSAPAPAEYNWGKPIGNEI